LQAGLSTLQATMQTKISFTHVKLKSGYREEMLFHMLSFP